MCSLIHPNNQRKIEEAVNQRIQCPTKQDKGTSKPNQNSTQKTKA